MCVNMRAGLSLPIGACASVSTLHKTWFHDCTQEVFQTHRVTLASSVSMNGADWAAGGEEAAADQEDKMMLWLLMACLGNAEAAGCPVQQTISVTKLSKISVSCPSVKSDDLKLNFQLLFNESCIKHIHLDKEINPPGCLFSGQFEVTATNSGVYVCRREVIYPPPFITDCHTTQVQVDEQQPLSSDKSNQSCPDGSPFIPGMVMWAGCSLLLVYSLSITCIAIIIWRKLRRDNKDTNVYANTRPVSRPRDVNHRVTKCQGSWS